ncbi:MAG: hypothetical protein ABSA18_13125 [Dehalococcoidia bacterium]
MVSTRDRLNKLLLEHPLNEQPLQGDRPGNLFLRRQLKRPKRFLARIPLLKALMRYV